MSNIIHLPKRDFILETYEQVELYRDIHRQIKMLTKDEDDVKTQLKEGFFADQEEFVFDGSLLLTYKAQTRSDIDGKRLKAERPDIYAQYVRTTTFKKFDLK